MSHPKKPFFFLLPLLFTWTVDSAAHAPSPSVVDCSTIILSMADCLTFVSNGSTLTKPQGKCCSGFKTVLQTNADCLCEAFKNNPGLGLNLTKAMELPSACKLSAPSIASCGLSISPSGAPVGAPGSSIAAPPTSAQGITEQAPAPAPVKAGSSVLTVSYAAAMAVLGVASIFF